MGLFLEEAFLEKGGAAFRPRVLEVVLGPAGGGAEVVARVRPWAAEDPRLAAIGRMGGSALALAISLRDLRAGDDAPRLACAVGSAVRRGLPTASRATVAGISPLSGGWVEGQVGGEFAGRLVGVADALVLRGALAPAPGRVLVVDTEGGARLEQHPELAELELPARARLLRERHPAASGLVVGVAGEAGVPFASLATVEDPPSFTGRGGLGARLGGAGLCALLVEGDAGIELSADAALAEALATSPHLRARGAGGTFELFEAFAARGDLPAGREPGRADERDLGRRGFVERLGQRQSCPGCPTACRHVLRVGAGSLAGRFSGSFPLGPRLGLERAEESLELLAACNALGVDAAETGASLEVLARARAAGLDGGVELFGDATALRGELDALVDSPLRDGSWELAKRLGVEPAPTVRRGAARETGDLAALLGQCVSPRGADPMRAFPFLAENGGDARRLARIVAPLELPAGSFDPELPEGKGRLVWWHENLANAVDASGFCSFSVAGLVGDGLLELEELSRILALPGLVEGAEAFLAAGASLALLQRELAERLGEPAKSDLPDWARERLEAPGMWPEYRALRGLDAEGRPTPAVRAKVGELELARHGLEALPRPSAPAIPPAAPTARAPGRVELRVGGVLAEHLEAGTRFEGPLPATLGTVLRGLSRAHPGASPWLWRDGDCAVSAYRAGRRLALHDELRDGDRLDLVVAIGGG